MTEPLLTVVQVVELVREETGIPICRHKLNMARMAGVGPKPAFRYGKKTFLYERPEVLAWARSLISPVAA